MNETELEAIFAAARRDAGGLPEGLAARMLADAARVQAEAKAAARGDRRDRTGLLPQLRAALGGWPGLGGLVAAGAMGVWLGFAPPSPLPDPLDLIGGDQAELTLLPGEALALAMREDS